MALVIVPGLVGAVRKAEWFQPYRQRRDIAAGALRIVEGREPRKAS